MSQFQRTFAGSIPADVYRRTGYRGAFAMKMFADGVLEMRRKIRAGTDVPLIMELPFARFVPFSKTAIDIGLIAVRIGVYRTAGCLMNEMMASGHPEGAAFRRFVTPLSEGEFSDDAFGQALYWSAFTKSMVRTGIDLNCGKRDRSLPVPVIMGVSFDRYVPRGLAADDIESEAASAGEDVMRGFLVDQMIRRGKLEITGLKSWIQKSQKLLGA